MIYLNSNVLLLIISVIGIFITIYLIKKRLASAHPICPIGGNCQAVLTSKYNKTFGVHNDVAGLFFYLFFGALSLILIFNSSLLLGYDTVIISLSRLGLLAATLMSVRFIYIQLAILKTWCFWCLMSSLLVFLMDIIVF